MTPETIPYQIRRGCLYAAGAIIVIVGIVAIIGLALVNLVTLPVSEVRS